MPSVEVTARRASTSSSGAGVAHHADRLTGSRTAKACHGVVEAGFPDLFQIDGAGLLEGGDLFAGDFAGERMARPGPGNGWRPTEGGGRPSSTPSARTRP